jgi:hypothetical protein
LFDCWCDGLLLCLCYLFVVGLAVCCLFDCLIDCLLDCFFLFVLLCIAGLAVQPQAPAARQRLIMKAGACLIG